MNVLRLWLPIGVVDESCHCVRIIDQRSSHQRLKLITKLHGIQVSGLCKKPFTKELGRLPRFGICELLERLRPNRIKRHRNQLSFCASQQDDTQPKQVQELVFGEFLLTSC